MKEEETWQEPKRKTLNFDYIIDDNGRYVTCKIMGNGDQIGHCKISINTTNNSITVQEWFMDITYQHLGVGRKLLQYAINYVSHTYGTITSVKYIWNGTNKYVYDWLVRNFDAVCDCPIAVQKKQPDDDWLSHVYTLDTAKFMSYMEGQQVG